ncbi:FtsX-like permease family protein [Verrucomicrobiales bacterium BCK34]|nr:FtsX-like permease family protein [Verrucomicrobiales bacterium BCK34]
MSWISLALRNLLRNARRSITTIAAVALGYAAINILAGFTAYMFASIEDAHIYEQVNGHVQIWKKGAREYGGSDPAAYLISEEEFAEIKAFANEDERVLVSAGLLEIKGNVDVDGTSGFFVAQAMVPEERDAIHSRSTALRSAYGSTYEGKPITSETPFGISITTGMAENLALKIDSPIMLVSPTVSGQMNALDAEVMQIAEVASEALNNRYIFMPLELGQALYETGGVSCVRFMLEDNADTDAFAAKLSEKFGEDQWEVIPWYDVSKLYLRTKRMFDIIFGLVFAIIATIVTMSVLNTIGMAVIERTREIGTLRAIGLKRPGVVRLFGTESALLGIIGAISGLLIVLVFAYAIAAVKPTWEPPVTAREIVWEIRIQPFHLLTTFVLLVIFTALAAIAPARRAAKQSIVDSLGHV